MPAGSLPQTQDQNLDAQVHQHQQQNLQEEFLRPKELLCQHNINPQAKHHIVRNHIHPKEGVESQSTHRTSTHQDKRHPNKATDHISRDNVQRGSRKRPQPHQDPKAPSSEPPRSRPRAGRAPVDHLALTKREIIEWSTRIRGENTSLRRRKAHALQFLGAQDATAAKGHYRSLSLLLHPDKNRTDPMGTGRFKVLGASKDLFD